MPSSKNSSSSRLLAKRLARKPTSLPISNTHGSLEVLNVAYNKEARSRRCLIALLKYANGKILFVLDIRRSRFTQEDFNKICEEHLDVIARIQDIESYRFNP